MKDTRITRRAQILFFALSFLITLLGAAKSYADIVYEEAQCDSRAYDHDRRDWLLYASGFDDYAGRYGHSIDAVELWTSVETLYKAHYKGGRWLPGVSSEVNDYAGIKGKPIDGISVAKTYDNYDDVLMNYQVHLKGNSWLPPVTGANINDSRNGYAGVLGREIDGFRLRIWTGIDDGIYITDVIYVF